MLHARRVPFPIQIASGRIGAQMPAPAPVRIHVRRQVQIAFPEQRIRLPAAKPVERPFHPPFRHRLPGMLPRNHPARPPAFTGTEMQQIQRLPVQRPPKRNQPAIGIPPGPRKHVMMPLHRKRNVIGKPDRIAIKIEIPAQHPVLRPRRMPKPIDPIKRTKHPIIPKPPGISRPAGIQNVDHTLLTPRARHPKIEPLIKVG